MCEGSDYLFHCLFFHNIILFGQEHGDGIVGMGSWGRDRGDGIVGTGMTQNYEVMLVMTRG